MKTIFVVLFFFASVSASLAHIEPSKTLREKSDAHKQYQKIAKALIKSSMLYSLDDNEVKTRIIGYEYDSLGRELGMILYDKQGNPERIVTQTYDRYGNLSLDVDCDTTGLMKEMNVLEYDHEGLIWNIISYDSSWKISGSLRYTPVPETNEVIVEKTDAHHHPQYTISYRYAENLETGLCKGIVQNDAVGKQMIRVENVYDENELRTHKHIFNQDDSLSFTYEYTYTDEGEFLEIKKIMPDGSLSRTDRYTYNEDSLIDTITVTDGENKVIARRLYTYKK